MSDRVGPMYFEHKTTHLFLGRTLADEGTASEGAVRMLEEEAARILAAAFQTAKQTISDHREMLDRFVATLIEHETIERAEILELLGDPAGMGPPATGDLAEN
jgi:cell division protease FtsH